MDRDFSTAVYSQGQFFFFEDPDEIVFKTGLQYRITWDEFEEAEKIADFLSLRARGHA